MASIPNIPKPDYHFNFARYLLDKNRNRADKTAYIDDYGSISYGQLADKVKQFAAAILASGVQPEQRVLLVVEDCIDLPIAFLGAIYAGVVPVPVNTLLPPEDYAYLLSNCHAKALVVSDTLRPKLMTALEQSEQAIDRIIVSHYQGQVDSRFTAFETFIDVAPLSQSAQTCADEPAFWLYSSGSTGKPKGTVHSHANPYWTAHLYGDAVLGITENDVCFSAAKFFFAYGLGNALSFPLNAGATVVLMAGRPVPSAIFERWIKSQTTIFFGAPTGFAAMLASPDLPTKSAVNLRLISSAGEALPAQLGEQFTEHFGVEIIDGIGSTEMLHIFLSNRPGDVHYGTTGYPVPGYEIELRNFDGSPTPEGEPGDLYIRGPSSALMYWANRSKSQETFIGPWTKSGDKYIHNKDGTYTYAGRSDDMIKVSGIYVSPFEVEATLIEHKAVMEAAVIGVEDQNGLTKTKAFIVLKDGAQATEDEIKQFVKSKLAPHKYPRIIEYVDELPKTATGKIQRFRLRNQEAENLSG